MAIKKKTEAEGLYPVDELATINDLAPWELASLKRFAGWAEGRQVSEDDFNNALTLFRGRTMGGGKL
ncbi:MAG: hypothetical protein KKE73_09730 [Proteobacteria bacterium]|nr:hypothetical protein [Pseudomonadota bacterium]